MRRQSGIPDCEMNDNCPRGLLPLSDRKVISRNDIGLLLVERVVSKLFLAHHPIVRKSQMGLPNAMRTFHTRTAVGVKWETLLHWDLDTAEHETLTAACPGSIMPTRSFAFPKGRQAGFACRFVSLASIKLFSSSLELWLGFRVKRDPN
jgi:hypothetical protein